MFRVVQGVGAACLLANSAAIITDAFPANQRGMALGINNIVGVSGMFVGLVLGGVLAPISWRLVFLISVPVGLFGTVWAYLKLQELSSPRRAKIDWAGNITFALGLILIMVAVTFGIRPAGHSSTGWGRAKVLILVGCGLASLIAFALIERRVEDPMFKLPLFKIRAFTFGTLSTFLSAIARGGLMFMLIIWLQGIWLPQHGYSFTETPLWAGIYMLPLTVGMLLAGPTSGYLSDRFGARPFATGGMVGAAISFFLLMLLPIDFPYPLFAGCLFLNGVSMGMFASPNRAGRDEQPAGDRPRRRRRHEPDLPELRPGAVDGHLLHAADRWSVRVAAARHAGRAAGARGAPRRRRQGREPARDLDRVRRVPRLQPDRAPGRQQGARRAAGPPASAFSPVTRSSRT